MKSILLLFLGSVTPIFAQLKWDQPQQKLSAKPGDKAVSAKYRFTNQGTSPVTIVDVRPSCGCTTATLAKKVFAPGESGEIDARFNFAGHTGHQEKWIYVTTNLAGTEPMLLTLAVDIPPEITIEPDFVMWRIGDPLTPKTIRVVVPDGFPTKIVAVQTDNPAIQVELQEVRVGKQWELKVTPTGTKNLVKAIVSIRSDYPAENPATYFAYARVQ
ncbi:MAG: DUF1573 domain-containing protein [Verrucomicrobia bacterium]|nr:DUF1573 domain-containing protein [Verrucomicrobiota bacterium]MBV8279997.1 DUF1573 domain-containing protein [Verrucomicrobiota bacterium]